MKSLEIIRLRTTMYPIDSLSAQINESIRTAEGEPVAIEIYRRTGLETDLAIHICRNGNPEKNGTSDLGLRLASELEGYGLVEHTVWLKEARDVPERSN